MPWLALLLIVAWLGIVAVARGVLHARAGGGPSIRLGDPAGSPAWWARVLGAFGLLLLIGAPLADLAGVPALPALDTPVVAVAGVALAITGIIGTVVSRRMRP